MSPDTVYAIDAQTPPSRLVRDGEICDLEISDWVNGAVRSDPCTHHHIHRPDRCPAVGPIHVEGARPGMGLCVEIVRIQPREWGIMALRPNVGVLGDRIQKNRVFFLPIRDGLIEFPSGAKLPVSPMLGVLGVAPAHSPVKTLSVGDYGGNLDVREIRVGARVHLPIHVEGGRAYFADVHAAMGDGELSGTGVECSASVRIRLTLEAEPWCDGPLVETKEEWVVCATHPDASAALGIATQRLVGFLSRRHSLPFDEAYLFVGATGHAAFAQVVNPCGTTCKVRFPRDVLKTPAA